MISYDLALALKNTGFPQTGLFCYEDDSDAVYLITRAEADREGKEWSESCPSAPTLSELIEACGEVTVHIVSKHKDCSAWVVGMSIEEHCMAPSPEEAVARLWLELNKK